MHMPLHELFLFNLSLCTIQSPRTLFRHRIESKYSSEVVKHVLREHVA